MPAKLISASEFMPHLRADPEVHTWVQLMARAAFNQAVSDLAADLSESFREQYGDAYAIDWQAVARECITESL